MAAALTVSTPRVSYLQADTLEIPVAAGATIFYGALVCTNEDGYAVPAADTAQYVFEGWAIKQSDNMGRISPINVSIDNSGGVAGALCVIVQRKGYLRIHCHEDPWQAFMSAHCYVFNDNTVAVEPWHVTNHVTCGRVTRVNWYDKTPAEADLLEIEVECGICAPYSRQVSTTTAGE